MMESILKIAGFVLFPFIGGSLGGFITRKKVKTWFATLEKPPWRPPNWAFGPVWTSLYSGAVRWSIPINVVHSDRVTYIIINTASLKLTGNQPLNLN